MTHGIDVSEFDGEINWPQVKNAGIQFAILRCGYGQSGADWRFSDYYANAKPAGLALGTYFYSYALNTAAAAREAQHTLRLIEGKSFELPVWLDMEDADHYKEEHGFSFTRAHITAICQSWLAGMRPSGRKLGVYASEYWLENYIDVSALGSDCDIWLAQWSERPTYPGRYDVWQYTDRGHVPGIAGAVDMDYAYTDYKEDDEVTQEQFNQMMNTYLKQLEAQTPSNYAKEAWAKATEKGVLDGTGPRLFSTREQLAVVLDRLDLL